ncbi:MAG: glycine--tRNA ligase subunit beta, partial [Gammaproteobacteria bacterium]
VTDKDGKLVEHFIMVANIQSKHKEIIKTGNEKVIYLRLKDAQFFWQRDIKKPLSDFQSELEGIVFQHKLGTLADKSERITNLAGYIADVLNSDKTLAQRAGTLSKCDLLTEMVGEFPKLQGVMGRYYAKHSKEPEEVAVALDEQYMPRFAGDVLPETKTGQILSIADKLDTLVGIIAIGKLPTGDKDPFGLRRAALGCLRIMIECQLELDLQECIDRACSAYDKKLIGKDIHSNLFDFMMERLRRYYIDSDISIDIFEAVISRQPKQTYDFHQRINAVMEFRKLPEAKSLAAANKRISNILKQADNKIGIDIDKKLLKETAEKNLASALSDVSSKVKPMLDNNQYGNALTELANLRDQVDIFFDEVMVMCDDDALKNNRLSLLNNLNNLFLRTADISRLQN